MIVRKLRLQRGWSQDQLAELTGLNVRTIQRIERGQKPSLESAKSLASVFEVDLSTFNSEDTTMNEQTEPSSEKLSGDEEDAIKYGKRMMEFYQGLFAYVICAVAFFAVFGFGNPVLYWVFLGVGTGLIIQGLFAYEVFRFSPPNLEKKIIEKKLGRKL
jgi:transcriptional regulator with XRE-family HTH domain